MPLEAPYPLVEGSMRDPFSPSVTAWPPHEHILAIHTIRDDQDDQTFSVFYPIFVLDPIPVASSFASISTLPVATVVATAPFLNTFSVSPCILCIIWTKVASGCTLSRYVFWKAKSISRQHGVPLEWILCSNFFVGDLFLQECAILLILTVAIFVILVGFHPTERDTRWKNYRERPPSTIFSRRQVQPTTSSLQETIWNLPAEYPATAYVKNG
jgi:tryptophan-rich sensory protein